METCYFSKKSYCKGADRKFGIPETGRADRRTIFMKQEILMDNNLERDWRFTRSITEGFEQPDFDDSAWESVDVPHDWAIRGPFSPQNDAEITVLDAAGGGYFYFQDREADRARVTFDYIADPLDPSLRNTAIPFI